MEGVSELRREYGWQVMSFLASLPLPLICDLEQQLGRGDKMILRAVGHSAGLLEQP